MKTIRDILDNEGPTNFRSIERTLAAQSHRCDASETALSALVLLRQMTSRNGFLQAIASPDCAPRIDVLDTHLDEIGVPEAADAVREVQAKLPESQRYDAGFIFETLERNPELSRRISQIDGAATAIGECLEDFLRDCPESVLSAKARPERQGLWARVQSVFT